jgi:hypothetical protein
MVQPLSLRLCPKTSSHFVRLFCGQSLGVVLGQLLGCHICQGVGQGGLDCPVNIGQLSIRDQSHFCRKQLSSTIHVIRVPLGEVAELLIPSKVAHRLGKVIGLPRLELFQNLLLAFFVILWQLVGRAAQYIQYMVELSLEHGWSYTNFLHPVLGDMQGQPLGRYVDHIVVFRPVREIFVFYTRDLAGPVVRVYYLVTHCKLHEIHLFPSLPPIAGNSEGPV